MKIGLVTDGTCDIPADIAAEHHIHVVPHHVIWGTETFTDGVNLTSAAFYERLARDPQLPKTAQPSAAEFAAAYQTVRDQMGADAILCVATSQRITGAYSSAVLASSMIDVPVRVIDSGTATVALGLTVLAVVNAIEHGANLDERRSRLSAAPPPTAAFSLRSTHWSSSIAVGASAMRSA